MAGTSARPSSAASTRFRPKRPSFLEISHTQLQYTDRSPAIAAITNITPNHLDQFSWDEYVGLKRNILSYQHRGDVAVLNADDHTSLALMASVKGSLVRTSLSAEVPGPGAWLDGDEVVVRADSRPAAVLQLPRSRSGAAQPGERGDGLRHRLAGRVPRRSHGPRHPQLHRRGPPARGRWPRARRYLGERQHRNQPRTDDRRPPSLHRTGGAPPWWPGQESRPRWPSRTRPRPLPGGGLFRRGSGTVLPFDEWRRR
ncbi:MAG: hypothetical protein IPI85_00300 [Dehalococcoidia bacterium]|nr:hypothetical protein [Dehalococcoidia bacterium]